MTPGKQKVALLAGGLAAGLLLAELALQLYSLLVPRRNDLFVRAQAPLFLPDARLGYRPNPDFPDHDENGFRNDSVPRQAEIVAMGDSHTYGTHVSRAEAWPSQLQALSGRTVYSIACGGWSPTHSLLLLDRALAFHPRLVIEAFYPGNDLYDCFATVYYRGQLPELRGSDATVAAAIGNAERRERLEDHYQKLYERIFGADVAAPVQARKTFVSGLKSFLRDHSKVYQLARIARNVAARKPEKARWEDQKREAELGDGPELLRVLEVGDRRTILTPVFRSEGMNLDDPRLAEGFRIALEALVRMNSRVRAAGADFLVILLPIKEQVFWQVAPASLKADPVYRRSVDLEREVREQTAAFLRDRGVPLADALPALRESLARAAQPYPESLDAHPSPAGHRAIAQFVFREIARRGLGRSERGSGRP